MRRLAYWWMGFTSRHALEVSRRHNRSERRRYARELAGRNGDRKAIYRALKREEERTH